MPPRAHISWFGSFREGEWPTSYARFNFPLLGFQVHLVHTAISYFARSCFFLTSPSFLIMCELCFTISSYCRNNVIIATYRIMLIIIRVFCLRAGPSLQTQEPRLQFCRRQVFHRKLRKQGCSFTRDWIGVVASRFFPHPTVSLACELIFEDLKRSQGHQLGGEKSRFG